MRTGASSPRLLFWRKFVPISHAMSVGCCFLLRMRQWTHPYWAAHLSLKNGAAVNDAMSAFVNQRELRDRAIYQEGYRELEGRSPADNPACG